MGKHSGQGDGKAGTDAGPAFGELTPEEKAAEFDASTDDPRGYAERNFGTGQNTATQWSNARAEQREQQQRRNRG